MRPSARAFRVIAACTGFVATAAIGWRVGRRPSPLTPRHGVAHFAVVAHHVSSLLPAAGRYPAPRADGASPSNAWFASACERAAQATDLQRRVAAVTEQLSHWAISDPAAALSWADGCTDDLRSAALSAVAEVLARQPERAMTIGRLWLQNHPASADEVGAILVGALVRHDAFPAALQFAGTGPADAREEWFCMIGNAWAQRDPSAALDLAQALRDQGTHGAVFSAVAQGWAQAAPAQLAQYALSLPSGDDRSVALRVGLDQWLQRDPAAAGAWIRQLGDPEERDQALAAYVAKTDQLERSTMTALMLAEAIADPTLRLTTLQHVVREWASGNRSADIARYVAALPNLDSRQRQSLVTAVARSPDP